MHICTRMTACVLMQVCVLLYYGGRSCTQIRSSPWMVAMATGVLCCAVGGGVYRTGSATCTETGCRRDSCQDITRLGC